MADKAGLTGQNRVDFLNYFKSTTVLRVDGPSGQLQRLKYNGIWMLDDPIWTKDGSLCAMYDFKLSVWKFPPRKSIRFAYYALVVPAILLLFDWHGRRSKRRRKKLLAQKAKVE